MSDFGSVFFTPTVRHYGGERKGEEGNGREEGGKEGEGGRKASKKKEREREKAGGRVKGRIFTYPPFRGTVSCSELEGNRFCVQTDMLNTRLRGRGGRERERERERERGSEGGRGRRGRERGSEGRREREREREREGRKEEITFVRLRQ